MGPFQQSPLGIGSRWVGKATVRNIADIWLARLGFWAPATSQEKVNLHFVAGRGQTNKQTTDFVLKNRENKKGKKPKKEHLLPGGSM